MLFLLSCCYPLLDRILPDRTNSSLNLWYKKKSDWKMALESARQPVLTWSSNTRKTAFPTTHGFMLVFNIVYTRKNSRELISSCFCPVKFTIDRRSGGNNGDRTFEPAVGSRLNPAVLEPVFSPQAISGRVDKSSSSESNPVFNNLPVTYRRTVKTLKICRRPNNYTSNKQ